MNMKNLKDSIAWMGIATLIVSCSGDDLQREVPLPVDAIRVAGLQTEELAITTRATTATPAEEIEWLKPQLQEGLNITYWYKKEEATTKKVARLKYADATGYTFHYLNDQGKETTQPAMWYGNGFHRFEGNCVPEQLYSGQLPNDLTIDQSDDSTVDYLGNYTLLERYLSMPPECDIAATLNYVRLPFQHHLARVLAYVLIDPEMGTDVKLKGYQVGENGKDDPTTTSIRFTQVSVLKSVTVSTDPTFQIPQYTPEYVNVGTTKVIPHFVGEMGSESHQGVEGRPDCFYAYVDKETGKKHIYPSQAAWQEIHNDYSEEASYPYRRVDYGKVPTYDLIVKPDEANRIFFELELNNGLRYEKDFEFKLAQNQQTVVYLLISREKVDYDQSGSELWSRVNYNDGYYGVNNGNGNTLSMAGSSWQRAYRIGTDGPTNVTDGSNYNEDQEGDHVTGEDGQYLSVNNWLTALRQAVEKYASDPSTPGKHHSDYFVLTQNITIDVSTLPTDFVFTGHLDGRGHTITLTGQRNTPSTGAGGEPGEGGEPSEGGESLYLFDGLNGNYKGADGTANLHTEKDGIQVPIKGYRAEVMNLTVVGGTLFKEGAVVTGQVVNCK